MSDSPSSGIQVIARAAAILREVTAHGEGRSLGQLAAATGLARSTVQRIVDALETEHLVQAGIGGVRPGWGLRRLGELSGPGVTRELRPQLFRLFDTTGETVDLSTLAGIEVLFLDRFFSDRHPKLNLPPNRRYPAYSMANGKALLAGLSDDTIRAMYGTGTLESLTPRTVPDVDTLLRQIGEIRAGGFAYDLEERGPGICAIGIGLPPRDGMPLAVSVVVSADRFESARADVERALKTWS
ncbi:IclR family transcriptional regulator [Xylophilus sp. GOD-11R]|uniref:IclR family transcriptional regulator n=1 Tax=Xylophilus sp. GOD-11R TaxID=3089814 RepID=UPI00298C5D8B|nr:IclR family transcriptional regulator [Xylophilus sp. GOD-11R]WPB55197.1 IclR family transcriptional regulator [Xylophilus sp. GOD-11R]